MVSIRTWSTHGITLLFIGVWSVTAGNIFADPTEKARDAKSAKAALLGVPLNFEANQGQTDSRVKFLSRGDGYALFLTSHEAVFTLRPPAGAKAPPTVFRMELRGANRAAQVTGADKLAGVSNYYIGNDATKLSCSASDLDQLVRQLPRARHSLVRRPLRTRSASASTM